MVPGIVQDQDEPAVGPAMPPELAQKRLERDRIELGGELGHQLARPEMNRPEEGHGFPCGRVEQNGICLLGRHPHDAAGAVLLEVAFVQPPQLNPVGVGEPAEFF